MPQYPSLNRHKIHSIIRVDTPAPVVAAVHGPIRDLFLINFELSNVILNNPCLPLVVLSQRFLAGVDGLDHARILSPIRGLQVTKPVPREVSPREVQFVLD